MSHASSQVGHVDADPCLPPRQHPLVEFGLFPRVWWTFEEWMRRGMSAQSMRL